MKHKVGDLVRLRRGTGYGTLLILDSPHNRNPWSCTGGCRAPECVEWMDFSDESGAAFALHVNDCELERIR